MKLTSLLSLSFACIATTCFAAPQSTSDYKTIQEKIIFTVVQTPNGTPNTPPAPAAFTMGHKDGSKTRDFYLPENSAYAEMKNLTRHHITGDGLVGGFFVDELTQKEGKDGKDAQYFIILSGQVHESQKAGEKIYSKQGLWMDSLGRSGTWVDEVQQQAPTTPLAACGGK